jgi:hypothetical protein
MTSLRFPDVNVWLTVATPEHVHHMVGRPGPKLGTDAYLLAFARVVEGTVIILVCR